MGASDTEQGIVHKQKLIVYTALILAILGFGSLTFGYAASTIGTTLSNIMTPL